MIHKLPIKIQTFFKAVLKYDNSNIFILPNDIIAKICEMTRGVFLHELVGDDILDRFIINNLPYKNENLVKIMMDKNRKNSLHYMLLRKEISPDQLVELLLKAKKYYDLAAYVMSINPDELDRKRINDFVTTMIHAFPKKRKKYLDILAYKNLFIKIETIETIIERHDIDLLTILYHNEMIRPPLMERVMRNLFKIGDLEIGDRELLSKMYLQHPEKSLIYEFYDEIEFWQTMLDSKSQIFVMLNDQDYISLIDKSYCEEDILFYLYRISDRSLIKYHVDRLIEICVREGKIVKNRLFQYLIPYEPNLSKSKISPRLALYTRNIQFIKTLDRLNLDWQREEIVLNFIWNRPTINEILNSQYRVDPNSKWMYNFLLDKKIKNDGTDYDWILYSILADDTQMLSEKIHREYFSSYHYEISLALQFAFYLHRYRAFDIFIQKGWKMEIYWHDIAYWKNTENWQEFSQQNFI